jgi:hypothetical protein
MNDLDEKAKALFESTAKAYGWKNVTPWEELHDSTREFYRDWVRRRVSGSSQGILDSSSVQQREGQK